MSGVHSIMNMMEEEGERVNVYPVSKNNVDPLKVIAKKYICFCFRQILPPPSYPFHAPPYNILIPSLPLMK